jgi:hypothetical protein
MMASRAPHADWNAPARRVGQSKRHELRAMKSQVISSCQIEEGSLFKESAEARAQAQRHDTLSCKGPSESAPHDTMAYGLSVPNVPLSCQEQVTAKVHDKLACDLSVSTDQLISGTSVSAVSEIDGPPALMAKASSGLQHKTRKSAEESHDPQGFGLVQSLSHEVTALRTEALDWLSGIGIIADQVTADRCANYADALSDLEKKAEAFRTAEKKPVLDQGRVIDARWKPIVTAADEAKRVCKKAIEPFLIAETERLEREFMEQLKAENGDVSLLGLASLTAKAGTFGRTISLRRVRKVVVSDRTALINHYHRDPRFLNDESVQKLLVKLADHDLQAGLSVPGATSIEEKVAA